MATTQIDGGKQIRAATITNNEIASGAAIALTKLEEAQHWLKHRTEQRLARGVEGTHEK